MATRSQRLPSQSVAPAGARTVHPSALAVSLTGWMPPPPADPLATITNAAEIRCAQCGTRLESASYATCPLCESTNPQGV